MPNWMKAGIAAGVGNSLGIVIGLGIMSLLLTGDPFELPAFAGTMLLAILG